MTKQTSEALIGALIMIGIIIVMALIFNMFTMWFLNWAFALLNIYVHLGFWQTYWLVLGFKIFIFPWFTPGGNKNRSG